MEYEVTIFDGHVNAGDNTIAAKNFADAQQKATRWAQSGDWDHPGTVRVRIVAPDGEEQEIFVDIG